MELLTKVSHALRGVTRRDLEIDQSWQDLDL